MTQHTLKDLQNISLFSVAKLISASCSETGGCISISVPLCGGFRHKHYDMSNIKCINFSLKLGHLHLKPKV